MGLVAICQRPRTSDPHPEHRIYPCLLRDIKIERPNQVWCADVTCLPMRRGLLYLVAIMDRATRKVLAWRLSNTMDAAFCVEALEDAMARFGKPDILNTDQGSQFTSQAFTSVLRAAEVKISMDGKGRWMDNVLIERLWRSVKYECVYLTRLRDGVRTARRPVPLVRLSPPSSASFTPCRQNPGRGIWANRRFRSWRACPP